MLTRHPPWLSRRAVPFWGAWRSRPLTQPLIPSLFQFLYSHIAHGPLRKATVANVQRETGKREDSYPLIFTPQSARGRQYLFLALRRASDALFLALPPRPEGICSKRGVSPPSRCRGRCPMFAHHPPWSASRGTRFPFLFSTTLSNYKMILKLV